MRAPRGVPRVIVRLVRTLNGWAESGWAGPAAGAWAFAQSSVVPGPSETLLIPLGLADPRKAIRLAWWTVLGSVLGAMIAYAIGALAYDTVGQPLLLWLGLTAERLEHIRVLFAERGWLIVALGSLPLLSSKATAIVAGAFGFSFAEFVAATLLVRGVRFLLVGILLRFAGDWVRRWWERRQGVLEPGA